MEAATIPRPKADELSLSRANDALKLAKGDWKKAAAVMREWIDADPKLKRALLEPLIDGAIWKTIRHAASITREHLWDVGANVDNTAGLSKLAETNVRSMLNHYALPYGGGKVLGDGKLADINRAIGYHGRVEDTNGARRRFFEDIRERFAGDTDVMVRKIWKEKEIRGLMRRLKLGH